MEVPAELDRTTLLALIDMMLSAYDQMSPLRRNVETTEVGQTALYLLSDMSTGVTGETLHVDSGFHIMGAPPFDKLPGASS